MKKCLFLLICLFSIFNPLKGDIHHPDPFFLLTIPKSGTHLIWKTMMMMVGRQQAHPGRLYPQLGPFTFPEDVPGMDFNQVVFNQYMHDAWYKECKFGMAHFNFSYLFQGFAQNNRNFKPLLFVRDLRDVCISLVYFQWSDIERIIGPSTLQQKLMWVITRAHDPTSTKILHIGKNAREAAMWSRRPEAVVIKYEDLVGPEGGGTKQAQIEALAKISNAINYPLDWTQLVYLANNIYGNKGMPMQSSTFRDGKIGKWKVYFSSSKLKKAFKKHLGDYQVALGYTVEE